MSALSESGSLLSFHGITGLTAILLMLFHVIWAIMVIIRKDEKMIVKFHRFSVFVWDIWLIPYLSDAIAGMFQSIRWTAETVYIDMMECIVYSLVRLRKSKTNG